jgi:flavin-dependent dehydrogenase
MAGTPLRLGAGARVAVIGGGPAGSYFALRLLDLARRQGGPLPEVTVFERKRFADAGPRGCNGCAGLIQSGIVARLEGLGVHLEPGLVQGEVGRYVYHTRAGTLELFPPPSAHPIVAIYRGNGPSFYAHAGNLSFDDSMLALACQRGARRVEAHVTGLRLGQGGGPVEVDYRVQGADRTARFDLVAVAPGLSSRLLEALAAMGFGYRPPRTQKAFQAELPVPTDFRAGEVHIFGSWLPGLAFAALVPKKSHLTLSMVGYRDLERQDLAAFLDLPRVRAVLPPGWRLPERFCLCQPRVAVSSAAHPYADRLAVIGDAFCSRLYKSGIDSAYRTADRAARAAWLWGVDSQSLRRHFYSPCWREVVADNYFGALLFALARWLASHRALLRAQMAVACGDDRAAARQQQVLLDLFLGEKPYRHILRQTLSPDLVLALVRETARALLRPTREAACG